MSKHTTDRPAQQWRTIAVTALPAGWANQYRTDNGAAFIGPAPALLSQQSGSAVRAVFASYDNGSLTAVSDNPNYVDSFLSADSAVRPPKRTGPPPRPPRNGEQ
jgi:hypothetical protein